MIVTIQVILELRLLAYKQRMQGSSTASSTEQNCQPSSKELQHVQLVRRQLVVELVSSQQLNKGVKSVVIGGKTIVHKLVYGNVLENKKIQKIKLISLLLLCSLLFLFFLNSCYLFFLFFLNLVKMSLTMMPRGRLKITVETKSTWTCPRKSN